MRFRDSETTVLSIPSETMNLISPSAGNFYVTSLGLFTPPGALSGSKAEASLAFTYLDSVPASSLSPAAYLLTLQDPTLSSLSAKFNVSTQRCTLEKENVSRE